ncbi:MAG: hypothetical protein N2C14_23920, partial [Planctomycetales bacterium]
MILARRSRHALSIGISHLLRGSRFTHIRLSANNLFRGANQNRGFRLVGGRSGFENNHTAPRQARG